MSVSRINRNCFHRNLRIWHACETFQNILLEYYLNMSCSILITTKIKLSDFRGHLDYQIFVTLSGLVITL